MSEVLGELGKDLDRLRTVTDRFSKIGSDGTGCGRPRPVHRRDDGDLERRMRRAVAFDVRIPEEPVSVAFNPRFWMGSREPYEERSGRHGGCRVAGCSPVRGTRQGPIGDRGQRQGHAASGAASDFRPGFSTKARGWGLGLSLVRRIVREYHGGQIVITEQEGVGTTFRWTLPVDSAG